MFPFSICMKRTDKFPSTVGATSKPTGSIALRPAFKAASVLVSAEVLENRLGRALALVVNNGCANAVAEEKGLEDPYGLGDGFRVARLGNGG